MIIFGKLESFSGKKVFDLNDLIKQFIFVLACSIATYYIDIHFLPLIFTYSESVGIPQGFVRFALYPVILLLGSIIIGPTKEIQIQDGYKQKK